METCPIEIYKWNVYCVKQLKPKITEAEKMLEDHDLATSLIQTNIVSGMYARLLKIGNKTGHTD